MQLVIFIYDQWWNKKQNRTKVGRTKTNRIKMSESNNWCSLFHTRVSAKRSWQHKKMVEQKAVEQKRVETKNGRSAPYKCQCKKFIFVPPDFVQQLLFSHDLFKGSYHILFHSYLFRPFLFHESPLCKFLH